MNARLRRLGKTAPQQRREARRNRGFECGQAGRILRDRGLQCLEHRSTGEGARAGEHLVKHSPKRKDIGAGIGNLRVNLFGSHVAGRADVAATDERRRRVVRGISDQLAGYAEVEHLEPTVRQHEDVFGFDVPMHDVPGVGGCERVRDLSRIAEHRVEWQRTASELLAERLALEKLGDEIRPAGVLTDIIDSDDTRMVQSGGRARFELEAVSSIRIGDDCRRQHLHRDIATQPGVLSAVHLSHPAVAYQGDDFIGTNSRAGEHRHQRA